MERSEIRGRYSMLLDSPAFRCAPCGLQFDRSPPATHPIVNLPRRRIMIRIITSLSFAAVTVAAAALLAVAAEPLKLDFSNDTVGADASSFVNVVGVWRIEAEGDNKVLAVDGRAWKEGQTATGIADKARTLYGERYAE